MKELRERIVANQEEMIKGIQECIRINSVFGEAKEDAPYGEGPKAALDYALKLGEEFGFKTVNVDNKAGYVEVGEGEEMIAVLGHLDVVPVGNDWKYPPFGAEIHDGVLYGRGIVDDKGPTIGAMYALKQIVDMEIPLKRRIRIIFGTNEEVGCACIKHYVNSGQELPVMGFTPDAEFPLIFFEKGMTTIIGGQENPTQGEIKVLEFKGGTAGNIVPLKCKLVLEGEHSIQETEKVSVTYSDGTTIIESTGKSAHGSKPELGENAIVILLNAIKGLNIGGSFQKMADFVCDKIGYELNGESIGALYQDEETGETTVNLGVIEYTTEKMFLNLDIRYPKNGDKEEVHENVKKAMEEYGLEVLERRTTDMLYVEKDSKLVKTLTEVYNDVTGEQEKPHAIGGGTYAKMFKNMVAFGPMFPGEADVAHQPNESLEIVKLSKIVELIGCAMLKLSTID